MHTHHHSWILSLVHLDFWLKCRTHYIITGKTRVTVTPSIALWVFSNLSNSSNNTATATKREIKMKHIRHKSSLWFMVWWLSQSAIFHSTYGYQWNEPFIADMANVFHFNSLVMIIRPETYPFCHVKLYNFFKKNSTRILTRGVGWYQYTQEYRT